MIIDPMQTYTEELGLSGVYRDGCAWTIVYSVGDDEWEFADAGIFTTSDAALGTMVDLSRTGDFTELALVAIKPFNRSLN